MSRQKITSLDSMFIGQKYLFTPKPFLATLISKTDDEINIRTNGAKKDVSFKTASLFKHYEVSEEGLKRLGAVEMDWSNPPLERQNAMDYIEEDESLGSPGKRKRTEGGKRSRKSRKSKKSRRSRRSRK